jgi:hypothetical protein
MVRLVLYGYPPGIIADHAFQILEDDGFVVSKVGEGSSPSPWQGNQNLSDFSLPSSAATLSLQIIAGIVEAIRKNLKDSK